MVNIPACEMCEAVHAENERLRLDLGFRDAAIDGLNEQVAMVETDLTAAREEVADAWRITEHWRSRADQAEAEAARLREACHGAEYWWGGRDFAGRPEWLIQMSALLREKGGDQ